MSPQDLLWLPTLTDPTPCERWLLISIAWNGALMVLLWVACWLGFRS